MRKYRRNKTLEDVTVGDLLHDFVDLDVVEDPKRVTAMTDEDYIQLMLKKELKRKIARANGNSANTNKEGMAVKRPEVEKISENCQSCFYCTRIINVGDTPLCACSNSEREGEARYFDYRWWVICQDHLGCWKSPPKSSVDEVHRRKTKPESIKDAGQSGREAQTQGIPSEQKRKPPEVITELDPETERELAILRDDVISSALRRKALQTIEKYRKDPPRKRGRKKKKAPVVSEKTSPVKKCQNCYYCASQRTLSGSCWCRCSNPGRSIEITGGGVWIKSKLNLPCWKRMEE